MMKIFLNILLLALPPCYSTAKNLDIYLLIGQSNILLLLLLFLPKLVDGQTAAGLPSERDTNVRMLLLAQGGPTLELYYFSEGMEVPEGPIFVGSRGLSQPFEAPSNRFILVIKDEGQENGYHPVARVTLEGTHSQYTLLLLPKGNELKTFAVNSDSKAFNTESVLFFNTADTPLAVKMDDKVTVIQPLIPTQVSVPEQMEKPCYQVSLFEPTDDGKAKIFSNTRWPHQSTSRTYIFLFRNSNNDRIRYKAIDEPFASR